MKNPQRRAWQYWFSLMVAAFLLAAATPGGAEDRHQGVASCASSLCHGATKPLGQYPIRQDEYFIWQRQDPHSRAYQTLHKPLSRRIGQALGLDAASAPACLACHAETPPAAALGRQQLSDGIGCESCHGGSERWLSEHVRPGITLAEKTALGMRPTWQRETRAALCLSCHQGDATRPITHAMMAAGHPRLVFELDTFTALQTPHHNRDADYAARKGAYQPVRDWLTGQATAAEIHLQALAEGRFVKGLMPEWIEFDCTACHHRMDAGRWQAARLPGAEPGAIPFADAPQQLLTLWLGVVAPAEALAWQQGQQRLHGIQSQGIEAVRAAAQQQLAMLRTQLRPRIAGEALTTTQLRSLLRALAGDASHRQAALSNEQRAMAFTVLADALRLQGAPMPAAASRAIEAYYKSVRSVDQFDTRQHAAALDAVAKSLP
ncbi:MAG: multiheme c-type cytochrome [Pseudomonadota bacterium]